MQKECAGGPLPEAPSLVFNHYMRAQICKYQGDLNLRPTEALELAKVVAGLRVRSGRYGGAVGSYMAFWGFAQVKERNTMLRSLQYALRPRVVYASQRTGSADTVQGSYFEGIVLYQASVLDLTQLEALMYLFRMSIGVAELDTMMSEAMLTCLTRIHSGCYEWGNWNAQNNSWYRVQYHRLTAQIAERERQALVHHVTGIAFTTGNMMHLFHQRCNLEI